MQKPIANFFVAGTPRPGGSKTGMPFRRKEGGLGVRMLESGKYTATWRQDVQAVARIEMDGKFPAIDALALEVCFIMPRPKYHFNKQGGLLSQHEFALCPKKPDITKLLRAVEDSLSGIVWVDDAQIVDQRAWKMYGDRPGAKVRVEYADIFRMLIARDQP